MNFLNFQILSIFIPTFFFVSISPGICMTMSLTLGMSLGVKRALWMMCGELLGVGLVAVCSVIGVATMILHYPTIFTIFKYFGGIYLLWIGLELWSSQGKLAIALEAQTEKKISNKGLVSQGFFTAIANPKGWAFMISLLPPFVSIKYPLTPQLVTLIFLILVIEFVCLLIYAFGGQVLRHILLQSGNVKIMNRVTGSTMILLAAWLVFG